LTKGTNQSFIRFVYEDVSESFDMLFNLLFQEATIDIQVFLQTYVVLAYKHYHHVSDLLWLRYVLSFDRV
jgi:hypothetical protein